ncbi:MAG: hypothetical protein JNM51_05505 [Bacteroidia bacterium]|nr:hypothetical protein [Bacteroidia bacterium]
MLKSIIYSFVLIVFIQTTSCKKKKTTVNKDGIPTIEFVSISPGTVTEFQDPITIRFSYIDYNGDIGENDPNKTNLMLRDNRNGVEYKMRIKQLAPSGSSIIIKGNLEVQLNNTLITNNSNSESVSYTLKIQDRAGNWSNEINTTAITVTK